VRKGLLASKKLILENLHAPTSLSGIPGGRLQEHKCGFICARGFKSGDPAIDSARKYSCTNTQQNRRSCRPSSGEETILSRGNRRTTSVVGVPFFTAVALVKHRASERGRKIPMHYAGKLFCGLGRTLEELHGVDYIPRSAANCSSKSQSSYLSMSCRQIF
jgi:hypothetical protein